MSIDRRTFRAVFLILAVGFNTRCLTTTRVNAPAVIAGAQSTGCSRVETATEQLDARNAEAAFPFAAYGSPVESQFRAVLHDGERPTVLADEARRYRTSHTEIRIDSPVALVRWRPIGPQPTKSSYAFGTSSGHITDIAVSPADPNIVIVGTPAGGIWRSADGGGHFVPVSDDLINWSVASLAFSKSHPKIVYAAMGDPSFTHYDLGNGVLRSDDAGATWKRVDQSGLDNLGVGNVLQAISSRIIVNEQDPNRVVVAQQSYLTTTSQTPSGTNSNPGSVYLSTDGGATWNRTLPASSYDIIATPGNPSTIFAASNGLHEETDPASLYRSDNGGASWAPILGLPYDLLHLEAAEFAVTPVEPNGIYLFSGGLVKGQFAMHLQHSRDRGATWAEIPLTGITPDQFSFNHILQVDPTNANTLYVATTHLQKSVDGGATWADLDCCNKKYHGDQHAFAFVPNSSTFYLGNDGGLFKTTDAGTTFSSLNDTLSLVQFYTVLIDPLDPTRTYGGAQDNGSEVSRGTVEWEEVQGGDGGGCVVDPRDGTVYLAVGLNISRFSRDLSTSTKVATDQTFNLDRALAKPFEGNDVDGTLYLGTYRLYVSKDHGATWTPPAGALDLTKGGSDTISSLAVSSANPLVIYVGSGQGKVQVSRDAGSTWTDISAGIPNRDVSSIAIDPRSGGSAYAVVRGWSTGHVFALRGGSSWADISGDLPDVSANSVAIDPLDPTSILVGTNLGVFKSRGDLSQGVAQWTWLIDGIPPGPVSAISTHKSGIIRAGTFGRGVYEGVYEVAPRRRSASQ